ncbi:MAG TPA: hypothetical protein VEV17_14575 [Bryobacteraceae bacterium]|nr:hypothetical protein [Bryobacteraceae bacterium]
MDVERTIEFILDQQAKAEVQMAAMREQQARADAQIAAIAQQQAKADAQIAAILRQQAKAEGQMAAIRKLIQAGMKMIVKQGERINEVAEAQKDLAKSQKMTETKLQSLIDTLLRGGNGHRPRR